MPHALLARRGPVAQGGWGRIAWGADWVIDAIDNIQTKVDLLKYCHKHDIKVCFCLAIPPFPPPPALTPTPRASKLHADIANAVYAPLAPAFLPLSSFLRHSSCLQHGGAWGGALPLLEARFSKGLVVLDEWSGGSCRCRVRLPFSPFSSAPRSAPLVSRFYLKLMREKGPPPGNVLPTRRDVRPLVRGGTHTEPAMGEKSEEAVVRDFQGPRGKVQGDMPAPADDVVLLFAGAPSSRRPLYSYAPYALGRWAELHEKIVRAQKGKCEVRPGALWG
ncbi:hypothetical protein FB451DRAFT_1566038 [Mycena latifolia]|nr:hypothetical protein FB451DRAFT_1566038 [Mycena latifolia]